MEFWKEKATHQGQENIVLSQKVKEYEARRDLTNDPTDSELQAAIPDWDLLEPWQKKVAKDAFIARRTSDQLLLEREEQKAQTKWNADLEFVIARNPSLLGKEQAFKDFAGKPSRRGVEPDILVSAFLHQAYATAPKPRPATPQPGLESGTGGPKTPEKPKQLSGAELKQLRETDDKAYREYIRTHDVADLVE